MDLTRYVELFRSESREQLTVMNATLLELERGGDTAAGIATLFRAVHTIKGMSATMGYDALTAVAHEMESLLDRLRAGELAVTKDVLNLLFRATDTLESSVATAGTPEPAPGGAGDAAGPIREAASGPVEPRRQVRIDAARLDTLMNLIGELVIARGQLARLTSAYADAALDDAMRRNARLIADLQAEIVASRLVPVGQVFERFPRLVRDVAQQVGKEVAFVVEGQSTELDRALLDEIGEPLIHLLRNAADHGVELPDAREAAGKPRQGRLTLSAGRDRAGVWLRVQDDGRGIDRTRVLTRGRAMGLVGADTRTLDNAQLLQCIAHPGFTTAESVSELSGRGVGVDAVISKVRSLGGSVELDTVEGQGTTFTLRLPATIAIVRALLARSGNERYALPIAHIRETLDHEECEIRAVDGREMLVLRDATMPLFDLRAIMRQPAVTPVAPLTAVVASDARSANGRTARRAPREIVVLERGTARSGLIVDELIGQEDIVVKPFDAPHGGLALFTGATILADGEPALIVDVGSLIQTPGY